MDTFCDVLEMSCSAVTFGQAKHLAWGRLGWVETAIVMVTDKRNTHHRHRN